MGGLLYHGGSSEERGRRGLGVLSKAAPQPAGISADLCNPGACTAHLSQPANGPVFKVTSMKVNLLWRKQIHRLEAQVLLEIYR